MPKRKIKVENTSTWNLRKPGGWDVYKDLSDKSAEKIEKLMDDDEITIDEVMGKVMTIEKEIKFASFGKTRMSLHKKNHKHETVTDKDILGMQCKRIEDQINDIKDKKLGRVGNVFKIKESITGPKKGSQEPTAVRHHTSGDLVVSAEEIKRVTLEYCVNNLENGLPDPEVEMDTNVKEYLHNIRMEDNDNEGFDIEKEDFENVL